MGDLLAAGSGATSVQAWGIAVAALVAVAGYLVNQRLARRERKSTMFASAIEATVAYQEMPYRVRRRPPDDASERMRLVNSMSDVQEKIAFHQAWIATESEQVAEKYKVLVDAVRREAGEHMRQAWLQPAISSDADVNMAEPLLCPEADRAREQCVEGMRKHLRSWLHW
ncbi:MAG: hypothetical protein WD004_08085 [Actinomycetota bacterium]